MLFSTVVDLKATVVCKARPDIHTAFQASAETIGVSLRAVYDKIDHTEPGVSEELVRHTAPTLGPVISAMGGDHQPWPPGYALKTLDGIHLAGTKHRLEALP